MKRIYLLLGITLAVRAVLGLLGGGMLSAQEPLKSGTVLQRTELKGAKGMEAILVLRATCHPEGRAESTPSRATRSCTSWRAR